jgi:hypothetical protein
LVGADAVELVGTLPLTFIFGIGDDGGVGEMIN